jgi:hypothetical protein
MSNWEPYQKPTLNGRFESMLRLRRARPLKEVAWPDTKTCTVLRDFMHDGQMVFKENHWKFVEADILKLPPEEARRFGKEGLVSVSPRADRFKIGPEGVTGWRPWEKPEEQSSADVWKFYDTVWVPVRVNSRCFQLTYGLLLNRGDELYLPFWSVMALGYYVIGAEEEIGRVGVLVEPDEALIA